MYHQPNDDLLNDTHRNDDPPYPVLEQLACVKI